MRKKLLAFASAVATLSSCLASSPLEGSDEETKVILTPMEETCIDNFPDVAEYTIRLSTPIYDSGEEPTKFFDSYELTPNPSAYERSAPAYVTPAPKPLQKEKPKKQENREPGRSKSFWDPALDIPLVIVAGGVCYVLYKLPESPKQQENKGREEESV